jgi:nicotinamidase-related amidase
MVEALSNIQYTFQMMALTTPEQAAPNAAKLLSHFRETGAPVFHVQHITEGNMAHFFHPNTEGVEIHESVRPLEEETVIVKHMPNSFFNTDLHEKLQEQGVKELIVCGIISHICIDEQFVLQLNMVMYAKW